MGFFNYVVDSNGNEIFQVSPQWWYFPATAIPCTLLVMAAYQIWRRNRAERMVEKRRKNDLTDVENVGELRSQIESTVELSIAQTRVSGHDEMDEEASIGMNTGDIHLSRVET
jgi:hypothetical protein